MGKPHPSRARETKAEKGQEPRIKGPWEFLAVQWIKILCFHCRGHGLEP